MEDLLQALELADLFLKPSASKPKLAHDGVRQLPPAGAKPQQSQPFSLEPVVLPALALIAFKCRYSSIRRRAISLLHSSPRREGLLFSPSIAALANTIADIEESAALSLHQQTPGLKGSGLLSAEQVPEAARFLDVVVSGESPGCTRIVCARRGSGDEWDLGQQRLEVTEYIGAGFPQDCDYGLTLEARWVV